MKKLIQVNLGRNAANVVLEDSAYRLLESYLERAGIGLRHNPGRDEVLEDIEQSIGDKLAALPRSPERPVSGAEMQSVLDRIGAIQGESVKPAPEFPGNRRYLCRITEDQWFSGVCMGLSAYSAVRIDWVRSIFVIGTVFSGGLVVIAYLLLTFMLPVVRTREEYFAST